MLGRSLGNYDVVAKLGEGGMGVVYLARHATLRRPAAIKVLRAGLASNRDAVARFFTEARAASAVRHPGIVEVYDFGVLDDRTAYLVMEYLEGESLAARMRRGPSTVAVTLTVVRAIARALDAVHKHGIVHRDLKPDNVFLVPDPELPTGERVKLLDFGLAKLASGAIGPADRTTIGTVLGTPAYMSPEQCRGAGTVDHRTDLYSLGCVAYAMLCGRPPFLADGPGDLIARHQYFEPDPPRAHRAELRPELEDLVLRLLRKQPRDRYATAADLVRAIDQLVASTQAASALGDLALTLSMATEGTLTGAVGSPAPPDRPARRHRYGGLAALATIALALLALAFVFLAPRATSFGARPAPLGPAVDPACPDGTAPTPPPPPAPAVPATLLDAGVPDGEPPSNRVERG